METRDTPTDPTGTAAGTRPSGERRRDSNKRGSGEDISLDSLSIAVEESISREGSRESFGLSIDEWARDTIIPPPVGTPPHGTPIITAPGTRVAERYEIERTLGSGGMGKVFAVRHLGLDKRFALKLLHDISSDEETRAQFYREARVASSLAHPNIVSVVDFGEDEKLGAFMVMELLEGTRLSEVLRKEKQLAQKPWCDVMLQLSEAVHHIHERKIVHGDIKPDNVILCEVPSTDRRKIFVKLLDFGLARDAGPVAPGSHAVAGTPHYMAPERLRGDAPHESMDIYSLGVLGYELLTGTAPFDGPIPDVIDGHLRRQPLPCSAVGAKAGVQIDERAESLIMRALAKDPAARQSNMAAFLYELRTLMAMLGMGRRRAVTATRLRERAPDGPAAQLFMAAPVPLAGVDADGRMIVANRAFARFVAGEPDAVMAGTSVAATRIVDVFPEIMAELRRVHISGEQSRRIIRLSSSTGPVEIVIWMAPGAPEFGDVVVTVHALPRAED